MALGESGAVSATWASRSAAARSWAPRLALCSWTARIWCRCGPAGNRIVPPANQSTATGGPEPGPDGRGVRDSGAELGKRPRPPRSAKERGRRPWELQFPGSRTAGASVAPAQTSTAAEVSAACPRHGLVGSESSFGPAENARLDLNLQTSFLLLVEAVKAAWISASWTETVRAAVA